MLTCLAGSNALDWNDQDNEEDGEYGEAFGCSSPDSVVPSKDCKLIQLSNEIPTRGDVSGGEDTDCKDGERVHELALGVRR